MTACLYSDLGRAVLRIKVLSIELGMVLQSDSNGHRGKQLSVRRNKRSPLYMPLSLRCAPHQTCTMMQHKCLPLQMVNPPMTHLRYVSHSSLRMP